MNRILISDTTLCRESGNFSFKQKIEIARLLERLQVDVIELPAITNAKTDVLLVRTVSSFVKKSILSVAAGADSESIEQAAVALSAAANPRIRIELSLSTVGMEYTYHKKPAAMLAWIKQAITQAKTHSEDVEFCALDATRAETAFLNDAITAAVEAGASEISVCDNAGRLLPDDFASFVANVAEIARIPVGVSFDNKNGLATAAAVLSVKNGAANCVKTSVGGACVPLQTFADAVQNYSMNYQLETALRHTELHRVIRQIEWITSDAKHESAGTSVGADAELHLDTADTKEDIREAVIRLGYDLSEEDVARVYEEFLRVAEKKTVGERDLEAIVASVALQVPATYQLVNYVANIGNIISSSAQITLRSGEETLQGIALGDGPIDAAFLALEKIIGRHYELDDFQIQSVTEGTEAMGSALVKLRSEGKLYSGNGISTDIVCASIRAYINAINKIVYEEVSQ